MLVQPHQLAIFIDKAVELRAVHMGQQDKGNCIIQLGGFFHRDARMNAFPDLLQRLGEPLPPSGIQMGRKILHPLVKPDPRLTDYVRLGRTAAVNLHHGDAVPDLHLLQPVKPLVMASGLCPGTGRAADRKSNRQAQRLPAGFLDHLQRPLQIPREIPAEDSLGIMQRLQQPQEIPVPVKHPGMPGHLRQMGIPDQPGRGQKLTPVHVRDALR